MDSLYYLQTVEFRLHGVYDSQQTLRTKADRSSHVLVRLAVQESVYIVFSYGESLQPKHILNADCRISSGLKTLCSNGELLKHASVI